jgi:hypothetical protein
MPSTVYIVAGEAAVDELTVSVHLEIRTPWRPVDDHRRAGLDGRALALAELIEQVLRDVLPTARFT